MMTVETGNVIGNCWGDKPLLQMNSSRKASSACGTRFFDGPHSLLFAVVVWAIEQVG